MTKSSSPPPSLPLSREDPHPPPLSREGRGEFHGLGNRGPGLIPWIIGAVAIVLLLSIVLLVWHAEAKTNKVALTQSAKPVTVLEAKAALFRPSHRYIGTLVPWVEASVGPQLISAYIDTVLVRPGATVKRNEVLATLDCHSASAGSQAVAMQARAIEAQQKAQASEAARYHGLLDGGFVSPNEVEMKTATSAAQAAQLEATKAKLAGTALEVSDCILRAPFDGEVAIRTMDPGGFVRPGMPIVSVVDRSTIRFAADVPEVDFAVVAPGAPVRIHVVSTGKDVVGTITRRAPSADPSTRTVHFEVDLPDPKREVPVGTTGELHIDVGEPIPATEIPLFTASVRGTKATAFVVEGDIAHSRTVAIIGEAGGSLFVDTALKAGARIVSEGRALLEDGDRVAAKEQSAVPEPAQGNALSGPAKKETKE